MTHHYQDQDQEHDQPQPTTLDRAMAARRDAWKEIGWGVALVVVGAVATLWSQAQASQQAAETGGGTAYVFVVPLVAGAFIVLRGLWRLGR
jgi:hypothetical protein